MRRISLEVPYFPKAVQLLSRKLSVLRFSTKEKALKCYPAGNNM